MSPFDHESFSDGDWDDREDLAWNEFDWEQYLRQQDRSIGKFLHLYDKHFERPDRLDYIASLMNWDTEDWTPAENRDFSEDPDFILENEPLDNPSSPEEEWEPYTLHRHPVYIASKALYLYLQAQVHQLGRTTRVSPPLLLGLSQTYQEGENNLLLAVQAMDFGDYSLCTAQMKRALAILNRSLHHLEEVNIAHKDSAGEIYQNAIARIFDLREMWLRVMGFCREEINRFRDEEEND